MYYLLGYRLMEKEQGEAQASSTNDTQTEDPNDLKDHFVKSDVFKNIPEKILSQVTVFYL